MKELRFRQIHLDFHTSPDIKNIAQDFDAKRFAERLKEANINSITCFARGHHGLLYYDSEKFPERVHPHLENKDLLKEQIEACHNLDINVPIYVTVQWDEYTAKKNPQWLARTKDGMIAAGPSGVQKPYDPGFYGILCVNSPYREFLKEQTKEVLEKFDADGIFFDIVFPVDCSCKYCIEGALNEGLNPEKKEDRLKYAQSMINDFKRDMTSFVRKLNSECSIFYNKGHIGTAHRPVKEAYTHFELETLPSGDWGYLHFPATIRYARTLGLDCLAQTGKFHTMWGDFHSFKNKEALQFECFRMLALNSKCLIGDQLDPNGELSEPVYNLIGSVYSEIKEKEKWCKNAKPIVDIAVMTPEEFSEAQAGNLPDAIRGAVEILEESAYQFDIIDSKNDFNNYKLVILPDDIPVDKKLNKKITEYIKNGGSIIATFESGMNADKTKFNLKTMGVNARNNPTIDSRGKLVRGRAFSGNDYAEYLIPHEKISNNLPITEHVMYMKGVEIEVKEESEVLADTVASYFDRTYRHFCSHRQTPSSGKIDYPAIVKNDNTIYFAHPVFKQYNKNAPLWCKRLVVNAISLLLPKPILKHNGPSTIMCTVNEQENEKRKIVHLLHYIPQRRSVDIDVIEDIIPLYNIDIELRTKNIPKHVYMAPQMKELEFEVKDNYVKITVPKINGHEMIIIE